jgi:hypothetical protein
LEIINRSLVGCQVEQKIEIGGVREGENKRTRNRADKLDEAIQAFEKAIGLSGT